MLRISAVAALAACAPLAVAAPRWRVRFFHDEDRSRLQLSAFRFCSTELGIATGALFSEGRFRHGAALVTRNAGTDWHIVELREAGHALFCLDETHIWMLGRSGVWFSDDRGRAWRKVHSQTGLFDIWFTSPERGFAVGARKLVLETRDGGKSWTRVAAADAPKTTATRTSYFRVAFATPKRGMIVGRSVPPREWYESDLPIWMEPEPGLRRQEPRLTIMLDTADGGDHWQHSTVSLLGYVSRLQLGADGRGLGLIEFDGTFAFPAEVHRLNLRSGASERALAENGLAITDIALVPDGPAYAAGYAAPGLTAWSPLPGSVRVRQSNDLRAWSELEVDHRAIAKRVMLAVAPNQTVWLACDTGMILRLEP